MLPDQRSGGHTSSEKQSDGTDDHAGGSWLERRETLVRQALEDDDYETLQRIAALPGGFGTDELRREVWPVLLHLRHFFPDHPYEGFPAGPSNPDKGNYESKLADEDDIVETTSNQVEAEHFEAKVNPVEHPDEEQVLRDTKRSFVTYPRGLHSETKKEMQDDLQSLIVHVLRLYPTLSYFQGYHDIMSVLYLTFMPQLPPPTPRSRLPSASRRTRDRREGRISLDGKMTPISGSATPVGDGEKNSTTLTDPESSGLVAKLKQTSTGSADGEFRGRDVEHDAGDHKQNVQSPEERRRTDEWRQMCQCAEAVSLCRIRDAMGKGMEPMMGMLKLLQRLLKLADPELSSFSSTISPVPTLPFFALSWILCLFSHDIDTLEPVQRMFDYLLSRNPISAIYLAVAILMAKKEQMFRLAKALGSEAADDPSLLHPLFSRLPPLFADTPDQPAAPNMVSNLSKRDEEQNPYDSIPISKVFSIADDLLARYPWDGPVIQGREVLGPASAILTYDREFDTSTTTEHDSTWTLRHIEQLASGEVVLPGACEPDEDEPEPVKKPAKRRRVKRFNSGSVLAVGVVVVGIGIAVYGIRAGGAKAGWAGWWGMVIRSWMGKSGWEETAHGWKMVAGHLKKALREVL